ncbi:rhamnogalacturonan lyase [Leadbetterella byssophila]|nr:rhamnogalacturonan lyase [Leadbetterella byssophila]
MLKRIVFLCLMGLAVHAQTAYQFKGIEKLGRGFVAYKTGENKVMISWRYLQTDPLDVGFDLYRNGQKVNKTPLTQSTAFEDKVSSHQDIVYSLRLSGKKENLSTYTLKADAPIGYLNIPLQVPEGGVTLSGESYTYAPNDASVGDVDGDGEYEIFLKWDPSNAHDNSHKGYTGHVYIDCYKLDGTLLWRIDLGKNIRAGAHYTQFMVYDLDQDGSAELVLKTADGTIDGKGKVIGDAKADYRNANGYIIEGPEFLTVFSGKTGEALHTIDYVPLRGDWQPWGDNYGNRVDRFLAAVAYLDGKKPSVVMCRGYYTRTVLAAFDFVNGKLEQRWVFDSDTPGNTGYRGQGNHNLRVGDVDGDGKDEIIYGSCTIDDDGKGLYTTGLGHGDALHLSVFDPSRKGLQVWDVHENKKDGSTFRDAATGEIIFQVKSPIDVGRAMAADIDPTHRGMEMWSWDSGGIRNIKGEVTTDKVKVQATPTDSLAEVLSVNMAVWWDGDLSRELLDKNRITKYNPHTESIDLLFEAEGAASNNGTKATPALQADLLGDWREEVLLRSADNKSLRLYLTPFTTKYRFHTFLDDPVYRISVATQNVAYNQPTQPGFYFGTDLENIFPEKELKGKEILLDAGVYAEEYQWSIGGKERTRKITSKDVKVGKRTKVELSLKFRGQIFKDYVYVTLN